MARTPQDGLRRRTLLAAIPSLAGARAAVAAPVAAFAYSGRLMQGGVLIGRTEPEAPVAVNGAPQGSASDAGLFVVGLIADAPAWPRVGVYRPAPGRRSRLRSLQWPTTFKESMGFPSKWLRHRPPDYRAGTARSGAQDKAFASRLNSDDFKGGFILPLEHRSKPRRSGCRGC